MSLQATLQSELLWFYSLYKDVCQLFSEIMLMKYVFLDLNLKAYNVTARNSTTVLLKLPDISIVYCR